MQKPLLLDAGSGGRASQRLISDLFARHFSNDILNVMDDAALLNIDGPVAMSTDTYTVTPLFFPGGSIGTFSTFFRKISNFLKKVLDFSLKKGSISTCLSALFPTWARPRAMPALPS